MSKRTSNRAAPHEVAILLTPHELQTLAKLAHYYQRSMGPMRYIVRLTAPSEIRAKYRFIAQESDWLQKFIESTPAEATAGAGQVAMSFASRTVIAFWGRLLASLHSKRARRRMKPADVAIRETLSEKFREAAARIEAQWPGSLDADLATRRPDEASWMRDALRGKQAEALPNRRAPSG